MIENCYYELVKDLLMGLDIVVSHVEKDDRGTIVTLHQGYSQKDLMNILDLDPLYMLTQNTQVIVL